MAARRKLPAPVPYNPLDKKNLGVSVADALLDKRNEQLGGLAAFVGAGVYAIYYRGNFSAYSSIAASATLETGAIPIYVGKAVPPGAMKGGLGLGEDPGTALFSRLREHAVSIGQVGNLNPDDFSCKYLVVEDIWIPLGESLLIERYKPVWNVVVSGFGNHDPGRGRYNQQRSAWDMLHPGRTWAEKCAPNSIEIALVLEQIANHLGQ